jgi:hypothetical protein
MSVFSYHTTRCHKSDCTYDLWLIILFLSVCFIDLFMDFADYCCGGMTQRPFVLRLKIGPLYQPRFIHERVEYVSKLVINGSKTAVTNVTDFLCVSLGSSTVQLRDRMGSRSACACSVAALSNQNGDRA